MLDHNLIRLINRGRCFLLVGSGPSNELGYPSWSELAKLTYETLKKDRKVTDDDSYQKYLAHRKYPELFRQAEVDSGSRTALLDILRPLLVPKPGKRGTLYDLLTRWPFACYLTTNFDNELSSYLSRARVYFQVVQNQTNDFSLIRDGVTNIIQKLHSDLDHPDQAVVTLLDYRKLYSEYDGQYFRDKLQQIFGMFDVLIVGHSLNDPDIAYILEVAKNTASPAHPIYMTGANFSSGEERDFWERYNIKLVHYRDHDSSHSHLRRILSTADRFIVDRGRTAPTRALGRPEEEVASAASLYLFRKLQPALSQTFLSPLVLNALSSAKAKHLTLVEIVAQPSFKSLSRVGDPLRGEVESALVELVRSHLIEEKAGIYEISERGRNVVSDYALLRDSEQTQAYGQFIIDVKAVCPDISNDDERMCRLAAENAIIGTFQKRGLTIANKVYANQAPTPDEFADIFQAFVESAKGLNSLETRAGFIEGMYRFVISPTSAQKKYLASLSQGYFLLNVLGLDPRCSRLRRDVFERTVWLCDSSVLLPLISINCFNHEYAKKLFELLRSAKAVLCTTRRLLREAEEHLDWAKDHIQRNPEGSEEFLRAALVKGGYKQNLFVDGYIRSRADGTVAGFSEYLKLLHGGAIEGSLTDRAVVQWGIEKIVLEGIAGFDEEDRKDVDFYKAKIVAERSNRGTWRSDLQVAAEAEVLKLISMLRKGEYTFGQGDFTPERFYFLSQSNVLDAVSGTAQLTTWSPESVYRYLGSIPGEDISPDLLQQCMLHDYYVAGISFIDENSYLRFFGPSIDAAKAKYDEEKETYVKTVEKRFSDHVQDGFRSTPDLEKPFFVSQMGWRIAEEQRNQKEALARRTAEAEARAAQLEKEKSVNWKRKTKEREKQEAARLRNLKNPAHVKKKKRQAKKRRK